MDEHLQDQVLPLTHCRGLTRVVCSDSACRSLLPSVVILIVGVYQVAVMERVSPIRRGGATAILPPPQFQWSLKCLTSMCRGKTLVLHVEHFVACVLHPS